MSGSEKKAGKRKAASLDEAQTAPATSVSIPSPSPAPARPSSSSFLRVATSSIRNAMKRRAVHSAQKHEKAVQQSRDRSRRRKEAAALGADEVAAKKERDAKRQRTIDNTREADDTVVEAGDAEVQADEAQDELSSYYTGAVQPKLVLTTGYRPDKRVYGFIRDLLHVFPNSFYYARKQLRIAQIVQAAADKGFTDLMIVGSDKGELTSIIHQHLPLGPTACYRLSSVRLCSEIGGHGIPTAHRPEVLLNGFNTRLGHRVGRMLGALFHAAPEFRGRRVATFHNQRDFIFFRHHRYMFTAADKAALQELGPRFTLKLRWLQHGLFHDDQGEYEFLHKTEMDTSRRRFFL